CAPCFWNDSRVPARSFPQSCLSAGSSNRGATVSTEVFMGPAVAACLLVTLVVFGISQGVLRYWQRDRFNVRRRLVEEFGPGPGPGRMTRVLFKDPEALELSTAAEEYDYFSKQADTAAPLSVRTLRVKLATLLQRAAVPLSVKQWLLIPAGCAAG